MIDLIGGEARIPNPALRPFEPVVGAWRTTGTHPLVPGTTFHGRASFDWQDGGAFLVVRTEIDEPEIPSGVAVIGSNGDGGDGAFVMIYFDERTVSRVYDVTMAGDVMTWRRDDPGFKQRFTLTIEDGGGRMVGRGEMARDGGDWEDDLALTYVREPV